MKLAVSGKGGVGKTTFVAALARQFASEGRRVIAIDADPAAHLGAALGFPDAERITPIAQMKDLIKERTGASPDEIGRMFKLNPTVSDLPDKLSLERDGVRLLVMGGLKGGGRGCACPQNALLKALLMHLVLQRDEVVIADMEAGVEPLGRGTVTGVDALIVVVEPGRYSVRTAHEIRRLAADLGLKRVLAVANKVREESQRRFLEKELNGIPLLGAIPYDEAIALAEMEAVPAVERSPALAAAVGDIRRKLAA
jgi:CO dehydrogenase maturation factor